MINWKPQKVAFWNVKSISKSKNKNILFIVRLL